MRRGTDGSVWPRPPGAHGGVTVRRSDRRIGGSMDGDADREFVRLASDYLDDRAERHPDLATGLGDHRFDAHLPDPSQDALASERRALTRLERHLK